MSLGQQYATGLSRHRIEDALEAAGLDLGDLQRSDLAPLEDFHTMGRIATSQLAELAGIERSDEVLDAGSGVGGTARYLADQFGCRITAVDLTEEYCNTSRWLNQLVGLDGCISVHQADVTNLPFASASFTAVMSQHVQMNVADKTCLYDEARRVLRPRGRLAIWDIIAGAPGQLDFPLPWADQPALSHLASGDQLRAAIESVGLAVTHWSDRTEEAVTIMETFLGTPPGPLGLHVFVDNFVEKANNLVRGLSNGRLRAVQAIAGARA
jgi:ubiquinone/menaquinone biosynthesis C-methylase UbiE